MAERRSNRINVLLDDAHAARLHRLAEHSYVSAGTLARSLLSNALDQADPDATTVTAILDSIPGAYERAMEGLEDVRAGRVIALADL